MPDNNLRPSESNNRLYSDFSSYTPTGFGQYEEGVGTLRASGGDYGGGSEMLIVIKKVE